MNDLRILLVEDMKDAADSMTMLLKNWGYQATVVYEGKRAIELAATLLPQVVFLDIGLPDMDGCEVARQLRKLPESSKALLVAITGYGWEADLQRCKEAGIDRHFLKPVDPDEIKKILAVAAVSMTPV